MPLNWFQIPLSPFKVQGHKGQRGGDGRGLRGNESSEENGDLRLCGEIGHSFKESSHVDEWSRTWLMGSLTCPEEVKRLRRLTAHVKPSEWRVLLQKYLSKDSCSQPPAQPTPGGVRVPGLQEQKPDAC